MKSVMSILFACIFTGTALPQFSFPNTFASRSVSNSVWRGTAAITNEQYSVRVMPSYLDVTLDLELYCDGTEPDSFKNALEIIGSMNFPKDAAITGIILWNGDEMLKAKLKPSRLAREQYESVVDRDSNQTIVYLPDPLIFENGWQKDNYAISIFPVTWKDSRKMRFNYMIPAINWIGSTAIPLPQPFNKTIATYTFIADSSLSSINFINYYGEDTTIGTSASFANISDLRGYTSLIRPVLPAHTTSNTTTFYTASVNHDSLSGSLVQVITPTDLQILNKSVLRKDNVILWKWHFPQYASLYRKQIVKQAEFLTSVVDDLASSENRVALVLDITGRPRTTFELTTQGSSAYSKMVAFIDSLAHLDYVNVPGELNVQFTKAEIDSIVDESIQDFKEALTFAKSLFSGNDPAVRRIILVSAGPYLFQDGRYRAPADTVDIITLQTLFDEGIISTPLPVEAKWYFWPGIGAECFPAHQTIYTISTTLSSSDSSITTLSQHSTWDNFNRFHVYKTEGSEIKVHSKTDLKPIVTWSISRGNDVVAEYSEDVNVVAIHNPAQFGSALAASGTLKSMSQKLPTTLAPIFGFVDAYYSLLALEEDGMSPSDQDHYRLSGVPPLTAADIYPVTGDLPPPSHTQLFTPPPVSTTIPINKTHIDAPMVQFIGSHLLVTFRNGNVSSDHVEITLYTLAGKVLGKFSCKPVSNNAFRILLPTSITTEQIVVVMIRVKGYSYTQKVLIRQ